LIAFRTMLALLYTLKPFEDSLLGYSG